MNPIQIQHRIDVIHANIDTLESHLLDKGFLTNIDIGAEGRKIMDDVYDLVDTVIREWKK